MRGGGSGPPHLKRQADASVSLLAPPALMLHPAAAHSFSAVSPARLADHSEMAVAVGSAAPRCRAAMPLHAGMPPADGAVRYNRGTSTPED